MQQILRDLAQIHRIPGWSLTVYRCGQEVFCEADGVAREHPTRRVSVETTFDLASLTKPLVGSLVCAALIESRVISLDLCVADVLSQVDPRIHVRHLLTHTSGLPAWKPLYQTVQEPFGSERARTAIIAEALSCEVLAPPGDVHTYSDIGFLVLLALLEAVGEDTIEALFERHVLSRCDVTGLTWGALNAAATEECPFRRRVVEGTVHDLNAAAMGGRSTHAGLFGNARSVARLADLCRVAVAHPDRGSLLGKGLATLWTLRGVGSHCGGWDRISRDGYTSTGQHFPDDAVGHLGYTGTSLWVIPSKETTVVLLTNRIHPIDDLKGIRAFRPAVHDAVAQALGWDRSTT